jgi:hypothetical protein
MLQDGVAHIAVSHCDDNGSYARRKAHRVFNDIPDADVSPPDSIAKIQLQVVRLSMDILESKQRPQLKQSNTLLVGDRSSSQQYDQDTGKNLKLDVLTQEMTSPNHDADVEIARRSMSLAMAPSKLKRKRSDVRTHTLQNSPLILSCVHESHRRRRLAMIADLPLDASITISNEQLDEIKILADAAMRLSICGVSKSSSGIKVKANTFGVCLADVAPILWRPGYLGVCNVLSVQNIQLTHCRP